VHPDPVFFASTGLPGGRETRQDGNITTSFVPIGHVSGRLLLRYYDLYQRLQLQFCVLLIMGAMDTRNM